jgi:ABC-type molybdate transport system permease subunit
LRATAPARMPIPLSWLDRGFLIVVPAVAVILPCVMTYNALADPARGRDIGLVALPLLLVPVVLGVAALRAYSRLPRV